MKRIIGIITGLLIIGITNGYYYYNAIDNYINIQGTGYFQNHNNQVAPFSTIYIDRAMRDWASNTTNHSYSTGDGIRGFWQNITINPNLSITINPQHSENKITLFTRLKDTSQTPPTYGWYMQDTTPDTPYDTIGMNNNTIERFDVFVDVNGNKHYYKETLTISNSALSYTLDEVEPENLTSIKSYEKFSLSNIVGAGFTQGLPFSFWVIKSDGEVATYGMVSQDGQPTISNQYKIYKNIIITQKPIRKTFKYIDQGYGNSTSYVGIANSTREVQAWYITGGESILYNLDCNNLNIGDVDGFTQCNQVDKTAYVGNIAEVVYNDLGDYILGGFGKIDKFWTNGRWIDNMLVISSRNNHSAIDIDTQYKSQNQQNLPDFFNLVNGENIQIGITNGGDATSGGVEGQIDRSNTTTTGGTITSIFNFFENVGRLLVQAGNAPFENWEQLKNTLSKIEIITGAVWTGEKSNNKIIQALSGKNTEWLEVVKNILFILSVLGFTYLLFNKND